MTISLRLAYGGTLRYDVPEGRPSAATAVVYNGEGTSLGSAAVTIDSVNTTVPGAIADGATSITVALGTGILVGRTYLVSGSGRVAGVRVQSISGTTVTLQEGIAGAFDAGATFTSPRITAAITSTHAAELGERYRCEFTYTVATVVYTARVFFEVVRSPWPETVLTTSEFRKVVGQLGAPALERDGATNLRFADEIAEATELVRQDILERRHRPDLFLEHTPFARPVALRVLLERAYLGDSLPKAWQEQPEAYLTQCGERYSRALDLALNSARTYDDDDSGAVTEVEADKTRATVWIRR